MWWTGLRETMWPSTRTRLCTCVINSTSDTHSLNFLSSVNDSNTTFQIASRFCQLTNSCPRSSCFKWSVVVPSYKSHYQQGSAESIVPPPLCSHSTSPWWEDSSNITVHSGIQRRSMTFRNLRVCRRPPHQELLVWNIYIIGTVWLILTHVSSTETWTLHSLPYVENSSCKTSNNVTIRFVSRPRLGNLAVILS